MEAKIISINEPIKKIIDEYPEVKDIMVTLGFSDITNPIKLNSMGRFVSLSEGSKRKKIDMDKIIEDFEKNGFTIRENMDLEGTEERKRLIKDLIERLHHGEDQEVIKAEFRKNFKNVSGSEIAQAEKLLMEEGVQLEEVQSLCSIHASMFDGIVEKEDVHEFETTPGHPLYVFTRENAAIKEVLEKAYEALLNKDIEGLKSAFDKLKKIDVHYLKKENLIFPILENYELTGPSKVMWKVDDDNRKGIKEVRALLNDNVIAENTKAVLDEIDEMVFKEENILFPMTLETFDLGDWTAIAHDMNDIGYSLIEKDFEDWDSGVEAKTIVKQHTNDEMLHFETGSMDFETLNAILNTLPLDVTLVDKDDRFAYFSNGNERIFTRTKAALGRDVYNCHPSDSVDIVESIIRDFKAGTKSSESFWIPMGEKFILIQYFALRDKDNNYLGTLEASQDIAPIQKISGSKRIID